MEAIRTLMAEHQVILRTLDALDGFVGRATGAPAEQDELRKFVTFIRGYADALHHGKEEDVLFVAMVDEGFSREQGPIAVMLHEHDVGREQAAALDGLAASVTPWPPEDLEILRIASRTYADLLRLHIQKEDRILYPMAEARLSAAAQAQVDAACAALDAKAGRDGTRGALERLASELSGRHGAAEAAGMGAP